MIGPRELKPQVYVSVEANHYGPFWCDDIMRKIIHCPYSSAGDNVIDIRLMTGNRHHCCHLTYVIPDGADRLQENI